jgi:dTMP kinase
MRDQEWEDRLLAVGRFITFEGGVGAGKSTQIKLLAETLKVRGIPVLTTREPGGSLGAEEICRLVTKGKAGAWDALTEALLFTAARHEHVLHAIQPALAKGTWVLCDRFADSTIAYQGYAQRVPLGKLATLYEIVFGDLEPDLTLVLDVPANEGLRRAKAQGGADDYHRRTDLDFHERVRRGFLEIAQSNPGRCLIIPAEGSVGSIQRAVLAAVDEQLK